MATAAPRTRKPASTPARPGQKSGRMSLAAASRVRVPPRTIVHSTAGPAIKLTNPAAENDPRFQKVMDRLQTSAAKSKDHVHPRRKATEAMAAAKPLPKDKEKVGDAQANQVDMMKEAETKKPEKNSFLELLRERIKEVMPQTFGDAEKFMQGEKRTKLKGAATGNINQQKEEATSGMKSATKQPPDMSKVESNEGTPIPPEGPPPALSAIGAADAVPASKPESEVSLQKSKDEANQQMAQANVTPQQLQEANDPRFSAVLTAKSALNEQATTAPQQYRADEQKILTQEATKAVADEKKGLAAFRGEHNKADVAIKLRQQSTKEKDEADRKKVADEIGRIYNETKRAVEKKLASLETDVSTMFDQGVEAAMKHMTDQVNTDMDRYKEKRYKGIRGKARKLGDWLTDLPKETNVFYEEGRKTFMKELDALVVRIADVVETRLKEAKDEIGEGQKCMSDYVNRLPTNLQEVGKAAEQKMAYHFDEMREGVDDKKNDLAQKLAQRYKEASDKADEKLKAIKEENKGRFVRFKEKLEEVYEILSEFKERISSMLKTGLETIMLIVAHPIRFLENLIDAIKKGVNQFVEGIAKYLKEAVLRWLFGTLKKANITIPSDLSPGSILKLVLQILGLTYDRIHDKAVARIGKRNVALFEKVWSIISTLITGGPAALWEQIEEFLGKLKEMVVDAIKGWVEKTVIKAAVVQLLLLFNPASAIIAAIRAIYDVVMFFIERFDQILDFVEAVINSVNKIARGDIDSAARTITDALVLSISLIIDFLARLIHLGNISDYIKRIIKEAHDYVDEAVNMLIDKVGRGIGKIFGKGKEEKPDERSKEQKKADLDKGMAEAEKVLEDEKKSPEQVKKELVAIKARYKMTTLELVTDNKSDSEETDHIHGEINPGKDGPRVKKKAASAEVQVAKAAFGKHLFIRAELELVLGVSKTTALDHIGQWKKDEILFQLATTTFDPETLYSFDEKKTGLREIISERKREKYGYKNPPKDSSVGLIILSKGILDSPTPAQKADPSYHKEKARYHSTDPNSAFKDKAFRYPVAILGHKGNGASGHWNRIGHKQTRAENQAWNNDPDNYRGPEHRIESAASGADAPRYRIPSKSAGSNEEWLKDEED